MLKLCRAHYIREGFKYSDTLLNSNAGRILNNIQEHSELKLVPFLRSEPLNVEAPREQKVSLAAQLISDKVAAAIRLLLTSEYSRDMPDKTLINPAFGKMLPEQDEILDRKMNYKQTDYTLIHEQYGEEFVLTRKIQHDNLEHFFPIIRFKGTDLNDHLNSTLNTDCGTVKYIKYRLESVTDNFYIFYSRTNGCIAAVI